jgi:hypothetical protein
MGILSRMSLLRGNVDAGFRYFIVKGMLPEINLMLYLYIFPCTLLIYLLWSRQRSVVTSYAFRGLPVWIFKETSVLCPEDGDNMFLQNIGTYLPNYTASYRNLLRLKYGLNDGIWMLNSATFILNSSLEIFARNWMCFSFRWDVFLLFRDRMKRQQAKARYMSEVWVIKVTFNISFCRGNVPCQCITMSTEDSLLVQSLCCWLPF